MYTVFYCIQIDVTYCTLHTRVCELCIQYYYFYASALSIEKS